MRPVATTKWCCAFLLICAAGWTTAQPDKLRPGATDAAGRLAEARADAKLAASLIKTGQKVAGFCANCHGEAGNSAKPEVPNLAAQNVAYLLEQSRLFAEGRRRDAFMEGLFKALSVDEKVGVALYFAAQPVAPRPAGRADLRASGEALYARTCFRCHAADGRGNEKIARIAGQQPAYLDLTLRRYRAGSGVRADPLMVEQARLLSDAQIEALAAYVSALP
jgi:cytochrome c553